MTGERSIIPTLNLIVAVFLILVSVLPLSKAKISDKRLCYDKACSVVISEGKTVVHYNSNDYDVLSFPANVDVNIYSKQAGNRQDLWGVQIQGKRGYAPYKFIREQKVLHSKLEFTVPTNKFDNEETNDNENIEKLDKSDQVDSFNIEPQNNENNKLYKDILENNFEKNIVPHPISPSYESVYDGTILPYEYDKENSSPSTYSIKIIKSDVSMDEQVQLNVYPNFISSTVPALTDILSSRISEDDETPEKEDINFEMKDKEVSEKNIEYNNLKDTKGLKEKYIKSSDTEGIANSVKTDTKGSKGKDRQDSEKKYAGDSKIKYIKNLDTKDTEESKTKDIEDSKTEDTENSKTKDTEDSKTEDTEESKTEDTEDSNTEEIQHSIKENSQDISLVKSKKDDKTKIGNNNELNLLNTAEKNELNYKNNIDMDNIENQTENNEKNNIKKKIKISERSDVEQEIEIKKKKFLENKNQINVNDSVKNEENNDDVKNISKDKSKISKENNTIQNKNFEAIEINENNITIKIDKQIENIEINITEEKLKNDTQEINLHKSVNNEGNVMYSSSLEQVNIDNSFIVKNTKSVQENLYDNIVPKLNEIIDVDNLISTKNYTSTIIHEKMLLDEQEVINDTSFNPVGTINSSVSEVPLKNNGEESDAVSVPLSIPFEKPFQTNVFQNETENKNKINTDINLNLNNAFVELEPLNNFLNSETQYEVKDNIMDNNNNIMDNYDTSETTSLHNSSVENVKSNFQIVDSNNKHVVAIPSSANFGEFLGNRNLLNAKTDSEETELDNVLNEENIESKTSAANDENFNNKVKKEKKVSFEEKPLIKSIEKIVLTEDTCGKSYDYSNDYAKNQQRLDENAVTKMQKIVNNSDTLLYVCITAVTVLLFSLGYYLIENSRRDAYFIAKINKLEKDLLITRKECVILNEQFKSTKLKLDSIEDQSFGSNEMVLSLKSQLVSSENIKAELEDQIVCLEKELENTSEAGLELERMLREILSSHNEENNPLAQSIEDLQDRLNDQQIANESLLNTLTIKSRENEALSDDFKNRLKEVEESRIEMTKLSNELKMEISKRINVEQTLSDQVRKLKLQVNAITEEKSHLRIQVRRKELEIKELLDIVEKIRSNNLDYEKLYEVSQIKAEAAHLVEERDELKCKLSDEEGAHELLEEHVKAITEEIAFLSDQCKLSEKEKKDAETRLEILTKFFEEKETQRQKEEAIWLEKQGEVSSTVDRLQTMQSEILNYKQQIEMLKREILDQEREYKNQISVLETKTHEQWVSSRQSERRLEEVKAESSQLRNRLTLIEKNINDADPEAKLHRLQPTNGEAHPLFAAPETSSSPLMFGASGPVPPPLPPGSFLYGHGSFAPPPPFLPLPLLAGSRPPPLGGGRLSSPPPGNGSSAGNGGVSGTNETPLPLSPPPPLIPFPHHPLHRHRSPPSLPPFASEAPLPLLPPTRPIIHRHLPPPPLLSQQSQFQPHQQHAWVEETSSTFRNSSGFHPQQRDRRAVGRNHKGSLHSSRESLDKSHHGKV